MTRSHRALARVILALSLLALFSVGALRGATRESAVSNLPRDAESLLSASRKLPLASSTLPDLFLVPGLSASTAERLHRSRTAVERYKLLSPSRKDTHALQLVYGIGPRTADKLLEHIVIEPSTIAPRKRIDQDPADLFAYLPFPSPGPAPRNAPVRE